MGVPRRVADIRAEAQAEQAGVDFIYISAAPIELTVLQAKGLGVP